MRFLLRASAASSPPGRFLPLLVVLVVLLTSHSQVDLLGGLVVVEVVS